MARRTRATTRFTRQFTVRRGTSRRGAALGIALAAMLLSASIAMMTYVTMRGESARSTQSSDDMALREVVSLAIVEAGVAPEPLAVAGLTGAEAAPIAQAAVSAAGARAVPLRVSLENLAAARAAFEALRHEPVSAREAAIARQRLDDAEAARAELIGLIRTAAVSQLNETRSRRLQNANRRADPGFPSVFRAAEWTDDEAAELARACRAVSAAHARGETDQEAQAVVDRARANVDVAAASDDYDRRLADIRAAWQAAIDAVE